MAEPAASESAEPASPSPSEPRIQLGPHADIYPESVAAPAPASPVPAEDEAPEPETEAAPQPSADAGAPAAPEQPRRSRRQAGDEAYKQGLSEGRAAAEREVQQRQHQEVVERIQRDANERVQALFAQLEAPTFQQREEASKQLAQIHKQTLEGNQALEIARQQVNAQMAADFASVKELEGMTEDDQKGLMTATSMSDFAKRVHAIGQRGLQERLAKLETELQAARARQVGQHATPEAANGAGRIDGHSLQDLDGMSLKDIRKFEQTPEYNRMVNQYLADRAAGRI
jgi:hypothetical protein